MDELEPTSRYKDNGMATLLALSPLSSLLSISIPGLSVLVPLVFWLAVKDKNSDMDILGREILNAQISWLIWGLICIILFFVGIGFLLYIPYAICWIIFSIISAVEVHNGKSYKMPLTLNLIK